MYSKYRPLLPQIAWKTNTKGKSTPITDVALSNCSFSFSTICFGRSLYTSNVIRQENTSSLLIPTMSCKASFFLPPACRYNMGNRHNAKAKVQILCETRKYLWNNLLFSEIYHDSTKKKVEKSLEYYRKLLIFAASRSNSWLSGQNPERARLNRHYPF